MIFNNCAKCKTPLGPHNTERVAINEMGLWFTHTECKGTGFIPIKLVKARAERDAKGNAVMQSENEYYQKFLDQLQNQMKGPNNGKKDTN